MKTTGLALAALAALSLANARAETYRPIFERSPGLHPNIRIHPPAGLPTWTFNYSYGGSNYSETFVGTNPSGNQSTTVPVYIIPVRLTFSGTVAEPSGIVNNTIASPIFQNYPFAQGGVSLGNTQYEDAFNRANAWGIGGAGGNYHLLLGNPTVLREVSLTVPRSQGKLGTYFGIRVITASLNWFDAQIQPLVASLGIPANALPIFITTQSYLLDGSGNRAPCCVGGYHSVNGSNIPYAHFTYIQNSGGSLAFAQDVSALSHEIGEWLDDPFTNNNSPCGIYETGDPLENTANYGDYNYTLNGFTYHLQDLANPVYFGAPASTIGALRGTTFVGTSLSVCQNGA